MRHVRSTEPCRRFYKGAEYGRQIESRPADGLEYVGRSGLLLKRFAQLIEQTRILDSDDSLSGEVLDKCDLLVAERTDLLAVEYKRTDDVVLLE